MPSSSQAQSVENRYSEIIHPGNKNDDARNWTIDINRLLQQYLDELESISGELVKGESSLNFAEAAMLIQGSAHLFGKKVDYLYTFANELLIKLHTEGSSNKKGHAPGESSAKAKDSMLLSRKHTEFASLDDMVTGSNLNMSNDLNAISNKKHLMRQPMMPLSLIPFDSNEKGTVMIHNLKGEELGNKNDFQVNVCTMHSSGCLLLPSTHYDFNSEKHISEVQCEEYENEQDLDDSDHEDIGLPDMLSENEVFANGFEREQYNIDIQSVPPISPQSSELTSPPCRPTVNGETDEGDVNGEEIVEDDAMIGNVHRRRSTRQAQKAAQELEKKRKEELINTKAWGLQKEGQQPELKKQIQKKPVKRLPKKLLKRAVNSVSQENENGDEVKDDSTLNFCCKNFFGITAESSTRKGTMTTNLGFNEAFEQLVVDRFSKQQEELRSSRKKKLKLEDEVKEEPVEVIPANGIDIDIEDDLGVDPLPDTDDGLISSENGATIPNGNSSSEPLLASEPSTDDQRISYEDLVRQHVKNYMNDVAKFKKGNDLTERVNRWEDRIKPILETENKRETFNIYNYGSRIIDLFENNNRKQTLSFKDVCKNKKKWEIGRYFLASLQLANNSNVGISSTRVDSGLHEMHLTLLSRKRHQEQLEKFGNSSGEH